MPTSLSGISSPLRPSGHLPPWAMGVVCVRVGRGREGGGGGWPHSAFTKPADLTFVQPGPAVRCQALLCDWSSCTVDLGSTLVSSDWLLVSPKLPGHPEGGGGVNVSPSGSRFTLLQLRDNSLPMGTFTAQIRRLFTHINRFKPFIHIV